MALTVWDSTLAASRGATQADIDILQAKAEAYGRLVNEFRSTDRALMDKMLEIDERARTSKMLSGDL